MQNCQSLCQTAPIRLLVLLTTEIFTCWILISPNLSRGLSSFHNIPYVPIFSIYFHIFSIYVPTDSSIGFTGFTPPPGEGCGGARRFRGFVQDQEDLRAVSSQDVSGFCMIYMVIYLYDLYDLYLFLVKNHSGVL